VTSAGRVHVVVMGVAGSGKTTVGRAVAGRLGRRFVDADDHHPAANVAKMAAGEPLTDGDRAPWLAALGDLLRACRDRGEPVVLACSALRAAYRSTLLDGAGPHLLVHLDAPPDLIAARLAGRVDHFLPPSLAPSQFAALEAPAAGDALVLDAALPVDVLVARIATALHAAEAP